MCADFALVTALAKPSVLLIRHRNELNQHTTGSGFFVSPGGYVLTCAHVVAPPTLVEYLDKHVAKPGWKPPTTDKIWVRTASGSTQEATRVYCDRESDIALLSVPGGPYPYLTMSSYLPIQGEEVIALGYPLEQVLGREMVVTRGVVSALRLEGAVFQLDAAVNPGSSGGPVLNKYGTVIGIAFAKLPGFEGTNFAVSAAAVPSVSAMLAQSKTEAVAVLFGAIKRGDTAEVKRLIAKDPKLVRAAHPYPAQDRTGWEVDWTPLHEAARFGRPDIVRFFLDKGADVKARTESGGCTPLHLAMSAEVAKLLLQKGADVNARDHYGFTPLHSAVNMERAEVVKLLLEKGADVDAKDLDGDTPLLAAALTGNSDVAKLLLERGADVNVEDSKLYTPLHRATENRHREMVKLLLEYGVPVNGENRDGGPLQYACSWGGAEIVGLLIERGADVNLKCSGYTPLHWAIMAGDVSVVRLLVSKGANVNAKNTKGQTPLHGAVESATALQIDESTALGLITFLMRNGASINTRDGLDSTPLHATCGPSGSVTVANFLVTKGAAVDARDKDGKTPLHEAAFWGNDEIAAVLLSGAASTNVRDIEGKTPLATALTEGHKDLADLLRKHGGKE